MSTGEDPGRSRRILLVEDDRNHRWVMKRVLETSFGEEVVVEEAENGTRGLERASQRPTPDLVLLDLGLPDIGGLEVLRRLRADPRTRALPIIVLTSSQETEDIRQAYENGANSFVSKSDSPEKMFQRLRMLPVYWLELNRLPDDRNSK
jgi:two-component system response regulator